MLEQEYKTFYDCASARIPNWKTANKNDLANAYIDNEDNEFLRNAYFSALMLRYWGNIGKYYTSSKSSGFTIDECYSWLVEAIMYALKARKWRNPRSPLSKDKNAPDKVINRCIYSRRQYYYYISNLKKNRGKQYDVHLNSLLETELEDHNKYLMDNTDYSCMLNGGNIYTYLRSLFLNKKYAQGIIVYTLLKDDCLLNNRVNISKVVTLLLTSNYNNISKELEINNEYLDIVKEIKQMDASKISVLVRQILNKVFISNKQSGEILCY